MLGGHYRQAVSDMLAYKYYEKTCKKSHQSKEHLKSNRWPLLDTVQRLQIVDIGGFIVVQYIRFYSLDRASGY